MLGDHNASGVLIAIDSNRGNNGSAAVLHLEDQILIQLLQGRRIQSVHCLVDDKFAEFELHNGFLEISAVPLPVKGVVDLRTI